MNKYIALIFIVISILFSCEKNKSDESTQTSSSVKTSLENSEPQLDTSHLTNISPMIVISAEDSAESGIMFGQGFLLFKKRKYKSAISLFEKAISLNAKNENALFFRAVSYEKLKDFKNAIKSYDAFLCISKGSGVAWSNRASNLCFTGSWLECMRSINKATILSQDPNILLNKGVILAALGNYDSSSHYLNSASIQGAKIGNDYNLIVKSIKRQFNKSDKSLENWKPDYSKYPNILSLSRRRLKIPYTLGIDGTSLSFEGTNELPYYFLTNLYVWNGSIIKDPEMGVLFSPGTQMSRYIYKNQDIYKSIGYIDSTWNFIETECKVNQDFKVGTEI